MDPFPTVSGAAHQARGLGSPSPSHILRHTVFCLTLVGMPSACASGQGQPGEDDVGEAALGSVQILGQGAQAARIDTRFPYSDPADNQVREDSSLSCTTTRSGACFVVECPSLPADLLANPSDRLEAGRLTIAGESSGFNATGAPDGTAGNTYVYAVNGSPEGGELLTIAASGGGISAFSGSVTLPERATLLLPSDASGALLTAPREQSLSLTWVTTGSTQSVQAMASSFSASAEVGVTLSCSFDAAAGTGEIDAGLLQLLEPGTRLALYAVNFTRVSASQGMIDLLAATQLMTLDASAAVQLELR